MRHVIFVLIALVTGELDLSAQMTRQDLAARMESEVLRLSGEGVEYNERWTPPGTARSEAMDCSNTVKWLYASTAGLVLPRTASDQYEELRERGRIRRVAADSGGLRKDLNPGDLLFWENTYRPKRKPPITHVMVYLGRDDAGRMRMAGSQGSRGVDVYTFRPEVSYGGYTWFLWFKRKGRFVAYGRPL